MLKERFLIMSKDEELKKLKTQLSELEKRNPAHCYGTKGFVGHQMSPELLIEIEELEDKIKALESSED